MNEQQIFKDSILNIFLSLVPVYIIAELLLNYYYFWVTTGYDINILIIIDVWTSIIKLQSWTEPTCS